MPQFNILIKNVLFGPKRGHASIFVKYGKFVFKIKCEYTEFESIDDYVNDSSPMMKIYVRNTLGDFTLVADDTDIENFECLGYYCGEKILESDIQHAFKWIEKVYGDIA